MRSVEARRMIESSLAEVWEFILDPETWPLWVEGFRRVESRDESWPAPGSEIVWETQTHGRGPVTERVTAFEERRRYAVEFDDQMASGSLETKMSIEGDGTRVTQVLSYKPRRRGALPLTDLLFIRPEMRRSLERQLASLRRELRGG